MIPKVYILLPVHDRRAHTQAFVECLMRQIFTNHHLVLIDDGSTDGTSAMVNNLVPTATLLRGNGNLWWAGSIQMGLEWLKENAVAEDSIILMINDDVTFEPDYLSKAIAFIADKSGFFLLSRFSCDRGGKVDETGVVANLHRLAFRVARPGEKVNCLSTRGLFARWKDLKHVGNFRPRLLPHYLSDYEYTIRAGKMGVQLMTVESVYLCPDLESTGHHDFGKMSVPVFFRNFFSKKSVANPFYWSAFVILAVPGLWILPNLVRVWYRAAGMLLKHCCASMYGIASK